MVWNGSVSVVTANGLLGGGVSFLIEKENLFTCGVDPPTITGAPTADRVIKGYNATLRCHANGNPAVEYEWFRASTAALWLFSFLTECNKTNIGQLFN